ncbi:MAG: ABC transporter permease subunit [Myxococcales bacterium]|nr:ABC transporter permease subunit [Myxococcales bacterium]
MTKREPKSHEVAPDTRVKGSSLAQDALRRLRRNKLAMLGAVVIGFMVCVALSADWLARYVTGYSYEEIHSQLKLLPPGTRDISETYPLYDGDKNVFDLVDLDRSGVIECHHEQVSVKGGRRRTSKKIVCPEIKALNETYETFFLVLFNKFDSAKGANPANAAALKTTPDGRIYPHEFPSLLTERPIHNPKFQGNPALVGMRLFNAIDRDHSGFLTFQEVVEYARFMRLDSEKLVRDFDANHDLKISRAEFPGAPKLRTFHLGTDADGRCLLTRLIYGSRISLMVGFLATLVSFLIGVTYGSVAGYFGGRVDNLMMRFVDVLYGLPFMFIVILLMVLFGRSIYNLFIALGAVQWLTMSRVIRGQVISIKNEEYVEAARAIGVPVRRIIFSHILRNTVGPVIIYSTLMIPAVILEEAFLSFLGLGVQDPMPSWGTLINDGAKVMQDFPWLIIWPSIVLGLTLFCFNFLGDGIRDALDPQVKKS